MHLLFDLVNPFIGTLSQKYAGKYMKRCTYKAIIYNTFSKWKEITLILPEIFSTQQMVDVIIIFYC